MSDVGPGPNDAGATPSTLALIVILSAQLMVVLDFSIVNVALPSIQRELGFSPSSEQWVVTVYAIAFGGLLVLGGRAGDVFGPRRLFLGGLIAFSIASLAGGFARSAGMLLAARAAQGVGAAFIAPTALALLTTAFAEGRARNHAIGLYGATASVGFVAGLLLGGALVSSVGWRAVLWVNVPIGVAAAVLGRTSLPADQKGRPRGQLDVVGAVLVSLVTATLAYLPMAGTTRGWGSFSFVGGALLAAVLLGAFVVWERHDANPLVRLGIFKQRKLSVANAVMLLFGAWNGGEVLVLALYLQRVLGFSPLEAGLASVPQGLGAMAAGLFGARLANRIGIKALLLSTTATAVAGHVLLSWVAIHHGFELLGLVLLAIGLGNGGTAFAATVAGSAGVADREHGLAGGLINSSRQIGSALGVAVLLDVTVSVAAHQHAPAVASLAVGCRTAFVVAASLAAVGFIFSAALIPPEPRTLQPAR
jgi:EmrB/QacA subfamily drug resistance transporter